MGGEEWRHVFEVFLFRICALFLPSVTTGGGEALLTLLSTFAFFDGGFPCSRREGKKKKKRQRKFHMTNQCFWIFSVAENTAC